MLSQIDLNKKADWQDYDEQMENLEIRMGVLQRRCKELQIPIMIVFEGFEASGKGTMIGKMIRPLDPRGFKVFTMEKEYEEDKMHPYLWRYHIKTPEKGRIHIFDRSWYQGLENNKLNYADICKFEKTYTDDGLLLIKFFLDISKKEEKKRLTKLYKKKSTKWRVEKGDFEKNKNYDLLAKAYDDMILNTDTANAPWTIVEAMDIKYAKYKIISTFVSMMEEAIKKRENNSNNDTKDQEEKSKELQNGVLKGIDLSKTITREEYKNRRKELQKKLKKLHNQMYLKRLPVVLAFEGWDAGGKGGAIKRITECIDPRGYEVVPIASPNDTEKAHHYLWRFWNKFPKDGHLTIFDRTWYGRVLVERIEGFASKNEWKRAYSEINDMERHLAESGVLVLKFWMHIDKDEQENRFKARQETPEKQWKITDEDWRNREKWDQYEEAVDEMVIRTSTNEAPWHIIEANSKYYARIRVLEIVVEALEKALKNK